MAFAAVLLCIATRTGLSCMTTSPPIRICSCDSLRGQVGLDPLLEILARERMSHTASSGSPEQIVTLERPQGAPAYLTMSIDPERIGMLGPILAPSPLKTDERQALWQAAIDWSLTQRPLAIQLACDGGTEDCEILARMGYPITTEIGEFTCDNLPWLVADDAQMEVRLLNPDSTEQVELVQGSFIESLDIPEAIPLRSPRKMIQGWADDGDTRTFLAQSPQGSVGLLVSHRRQETAEITYIGVINGQRRRGWGARLLGQFLKWAKEAGVQRVSVIVDRRNTPAIQLYRRFGFQEASVWMPVVFHAVPTSHLHASHK